MSALPKMRWTEAEYLAFERASQDKHEFINGEVLLMAGASRHHVKIVTNMVTTLNNQIGERLCSVYSNDLRVRIPPRRDYTYPDLVVVCGEELYADDEEDTLLNPVVIIEVLSASTKRYDRGDKFQLYKMIDSLQDYILIAQDHVRIERYSRQSDRTWVYSEIVENDGVLDLPSIGCILAASAVYRRVEFDRDDE